MIVYRICTTTYAEDISGIGAKKHGGRWNPVGYKMLYAASHISLAALEILVHNANGIFLPKYVLLTLELPDLKSAKAINPDQLKKDWYRDMSYTQMVGMDFLQSELLYMAVPSVVIQQEHNYIINPLHVKFGEVKVVNISPFDWDKRLLK